MKTIAQKLLEFQCSIETIKKDGKNTFFKKPDGKASTYATLPHILSEVKPMLNALKLVITQPLSGADVWTIITDTETAEKVESSITLPPGLNAQQTGSAITYYRRYTLCSLLALEIDEDDDGNTASQPAKKKLAELVEEAQHTLLISTTLDELQANWKRIGKDMQMQPTCIEAKEKMKTKLTPVTA